MNAGIFRIAFILCLLGWLMLQSCTDSPLSEPVAESNSNSLLKLNSFSPREGSEGTLVTLLGEGFGSDSSAVSVRFGDVPAEIVSVSPTEITVRVPFAPRNAVIIVSLGGYQAALSDTFRTWFNAGSYRHGLIEISNAGIRRTIAESISPTASRNWYYDVTESYTRSIEHCGNGCDSGASATTIVLCCSSSGYPSSELNFTVSVDTLTQRIVRAVMSYRSNALSDTARRWFVQTTESIVLNDFPYSEAPDGSLVCTIPAEYLRMGGGRTWMVFETAADHYPSDADVIYENADSIRYERVEFNGLSSSEAYMRVTLSR